MKPLEPPSDLTIPAPGSRTFHDLSSRSLARVMRELPALVAEAAREARASGTKAWLDALTRDAGAAASLLRRPHLGGLARVLRSPGRDDRRALLLELLGTLAYELAVAGAVDARLTLERMPPRVLALGARVAVAPRDTARRVTFSSGRVEGLEDASTRAPYLVVEEPLLLALEDNNPLAMLEAHPDKDGNAVSLGGERVEAWLSALREAIALLDASVPETAAELRAGVAIVVPVGFDAERHLSASYREVPGAIYLSLHPDPLTLAEALVHELAHTKLHALLELDPVLEGGDATLHVSPIRPDPRPLSGVLLAVHAMVAVLGLHERLAAVDHPRSRAPGFSARAQALQAGAGEGIGVLAAHARPTRVGAGVLDELARWADRQVRPPTGS